MHKEFVRYPDLFITAPGKGTQEEAYKLANQLHLAGIHAEFDYEGKSMKNQVRRADKLKARYVLILGEEELKKGRAVLRNMGDKSQEELPLENLPDVLKRKIFSD